MLKLEKLKGIVPNNVLEQLPVVTEINGPLRLSHFLSQCAHESANFTAIRENLNYSAIGLRKVFGRYFTEEESEVYARKPMQIANKVYCNRMGNGPEECGDGSLYLGRGYLGLTGKDNYVAFAKFIGVPEIVTNPDLVATKYPLSSAAFFFSENNIWGVCDRGASNATIESVTRRINGGINGLQDRIRYFSKFYPLVR